MSELKVYIMTLEGKTFRVVKELSAYDTTMPRLMRDKVQDAYVRTDIVATPAVLEYLKAVLSKINVENLLVPHKKSIQRALLKIVYIENLIHEDNSH